MTEQAIEAIQLATDPQAVLNIRAELAGEIKALTLKLYEHRRRALIPKGKEFTELDRTINLNADTATLESDLLFLKLLDDLLAAKFKLLGYQGK